MRRVTIIAAVLALVVPSVAAARTSAPGDGTLVLKDANAALVTIQAKGGVVGRFDQGSLLIKDPNPGDDFDPVVTGADKTHAINDFWTRYSGKDVRFRFIGSRFTIRITGMANSGTGALGVDLSAVGQGSVILQGAGTADDGTYSFNGDAPKPLPLLSKPFDLGATL